MTGAELSRYKELSGSFCAVDQKSPFFLLQLAVAEIS